MSTFSTILPGNYEGLGQGNNSYFGGGSMSPQAGSDLRRALYAGAQNPAFGGGGPYQVHSVDRVLRNLTFNEKSFVNFRRTEKKDVESTFHMFDLVHDYAGEGGAFLNAGERPAIQNAPLSRKGIFMKYIGTQAEVVHQMMVVKPAHEDPITLKVRHSAMYLLEQQERSMLFGNSAVVPQEWDGWVAQLLADPEFVAQNTYDLRGADLTEDHVEDGATRIIERHGVPNEFYMTPHMLKQITKEYYSRQRTTLAASSMIGFQALGQVCSGTNVDFLTNIHWRPGRRNGVVTPPTTETYPLAPPPPASVSGSAPASDASSLFDSTTAGTYHYWVTAENRFGESAPTRTTSALTIAAGESTTLTPVSGGASTTGYKIYRGAAGSTDVSTAKLIRRLSLNETYTDRNILLPGHGMALMMQGDTMNRYMAMLCPMIRVPLSRNALSTRFALVQYGHPVMCSPQRNYLFYNVPDSNS